MGPALYLGAHEGKHMHPFPRLHDLRKDRRARRADARAIFDALVREDLAATPLGDLERLIRAAKREEYLFEHYLGEPMPSHLRSGLLVEVQLWIQVYDALQPPLPEEEYAVRAAALRPTVSTLLDVLTLEEEMLASPLTRHYEALLATYR